MDGVGKTRICSKQETKLKARDIIAAKVDREFPHLPRKARRRLVTMTTNQVLRENPGKQLAVVTKPANRWQWLKWKIAPAWFVSRFPVRTIEA
jgi:hypothetical protein